MSIYCYTFPIPDDFEQKTVMEQELFIEHHTCPTKGEVVFVLEKLHHLETVGGLFYIATWRYCLDAIDCLSAEREFPMLQRTGAVLQNAFCRIKCNDIDFGQHSITVRKIVPVRIADCLDDYIMDNERVQGRLI